MSEEIEEQIFDPKIVYYAFTEPEDKIPKYLRGMNIPCERIDLKIADYITAGVAIERKADDDYIDSIIDGRLNNQCYQMSVAYPLSVLIIEGNVQMALVEGRFDRNSYWSSRVGDFMKQAPDGEQGIIHVIQTSTFFESTLVIRYIREKAISQEPRLLRPPKIKYSPDQMLVYVVASVPSIGPERAKRLLEEHGTPRKVFLSKDWTTTPGIGDKINFAVQALLDSHYEGDE